MRPDPGWRPVAAIIAAYVVGVAPSLGQPLLETHAYRQTQTAYTAVLFHDRGIDLLRPPLPIFGPPGVAPLEFPLFQAAGSIVMGLGLPADTAMRLVGLASFVAAAVLVALLAGRLMGPTGRVVAVAAFCLNPHAWLYGRTSLIEYLAVAGGLAFLLFGTRWLDRGGTGSFALALLGGIIGTLVKITTGGFYLLPLLLWRSQGRWGFQRASTWVLVAVPVTAGLAWSRWADAVREATPAAEFLATENQVGWLFGDLAQRLAPEFWRVPVVALLMLTGFGLVAWAPLAVRRLRGAEQRPFAMALLSLTVVMPLLLFNLYAVHDYYWAAVAPPIAIGIGLGAERLASTWRSRWSRRLAVALAGAWVATIIGTFGSWSLIYRTPPEQEPALRIANFVRDRSEPDDWVLLEGWGWNSTFLYYARRQGLALPDEDTVQDTSEMDLGAIVADPTYGPHIVCDRDAQCRELPQP